MAEFHHFDCEICGQEFKNALDNRTHMFKEHEQYGGSCPLCDLQHLTLNELIWHVNTAHSLALSPEPDNIGVPRDKHVESTPREPMTSLQIHACTVVDLDKTPLNDVEQGSQVSHSIFQEFSASRKLNGKSCIISKDTCSSCNTEDLPATKFKSLNDVSEPNKNISTCSGISKGTEKSCSSCLSLQLVEVNTMSYTGSEQKQPGNEAESSFIGSQSNTADVNIRTKESSLTLRPSPLSPFKKCVHRNKRQHSDNQLMHVSEPDYPSCDITGLNREAIAKHIDSDHMDVVVNANPSVHVPGVNNAVLHSLWNTPILRKHKPLNSPQKMLFGGSKQAPCLKTVVTCPICGLDSYDVDSLTDHVNTEHPVSDNKQSDAFSEGSGIRQMLAMPEDQAGPTCSNTNSSTDADKSCPICGLCAMDAAALKVHVEGHFEDEHQASHSGDWLLAQQLAEEERQLQDTKQRETFQQLQVKYGMDDSESYIQQAEKDLERAVVKGQLTVTDYHQQRESLLKSVGVNIDDGKSCTSGLISKMVRYYTCQATQGLRFIKLCCETDHYYSSYGDKGWGCGYRNLQMLLSSLVRISEFREVIFSGQRLIPSIIKIQQLIEEAWDKGFDCRGCEQLGGHLVNSRKWIGATEIVTLLSSLHAKCSLFDFHTPSGTGGTHPAMFEWVQEYFGKPGTTFNPWAHENKENIKTQRLPLYLQHEGHSRTIIGCEVHRDKSIRLLLFDPSHYMQGLGSTSMDAHAMRPIRKNLAQMKAKQYQIVSVDGLITSEQDYEFVVFTQSDSCTCSLDKCQKLNVVNSASTSVWK